MTGNYFGFMILTRALNKNHMQVTKCDICKKQIKDYTEEISVSPLGRMSGFVFCPECGKPVMKFLEKNRLGEKVKK